MEITIELFKKHFFMSYKAYSGKKVGTDVVWSIIERSSRH